MSTLTDFLIGWGSLNALLVALPFAVAYWRGAFVPRPSENLTTATDHMRLTQHREWQ